eukprot:gene4637-6518_t
MISTNSIIDSVSFENTEISNRMSLMIATKTDSASMNIAKSLYHKCLWKPLLNESNNSDGYNNKSDIELNADKNYFNNNITNNQTEPVINAAMVDENYSIDDNSMDLLFNTDIPLVSNSVLLWIIDEPLLHFNHPDAIFQSKFLTNSNYSSTISHKNSPINICEVIFLSKHAAASGITSLTVHPIGIPWLTDNTRAGGIPGKCSPPNSRISSLYREILDLTKTNNQQDNFQITLEATHHGPFVSIPTCFVEIGSSEVGWSDPIAGKLWAECLSRHFQLPLRNNGKSETQESDGMIISTSIPGIDGKNIEKLKQVQKVVVIGIGGGHYVPKMNDLARLGEGLYIAHALATYTLQSHLDGSEPAPVPGGWQQIIMAAIESTLTTYPDGNLICLIDKKAFQATYRNSITLFLDSNSIKWTFKVDDVKKLWQQSFTN